MLSMGVREGGRFELRFSAPADVGALVEAAVSEARDALFGAGVPQVTGADALVEICQRSLGGVRSPGRRDCFGVYVHLDAEGGWLNGRPRLPQHLVAKLTCAGSVQPLWEAAGVPVSVGRALRIVPGRTRRLVLDRDRGCRFPGCVARAHLEVHHVVHWADGGGTDLDNLVAVCPFHHDAHHRGEFRITGDANVAGGLVFLARGGFAIGPGPTYAPPAPGNRPAPTAGSAGRVCTIGVSTLDPDGPDGPDGTGPGIDLGDLNDVDDLGDLGYPRRTPTPSRAIRTSCGPESHRRWPTRARPGKCCTASGSPSTKAQPSRSDTRAVNRGSTPRHDRASTPKRSGSGWGAHSAGR